MKHKQTRNNVLPGERLEDPNLLPFDVLVMEADTKNILRP